MAKRKAKKEEELIVAPMPPPPSEDTWLSHGIDTQNRIIELTGMIAEPMMSMVLRSIIKLNNISHDPITIYLNSPGGSVPDGLAIYDILRSSPSPIIIYATGKISSMGIIILVAGDERYAAANTQFMMHAASGSIEGKIHDMESEVKAIRRWDELTNRLVASRTKLTLKKLRELMLKPDHYFDLTTARKYGIISPILKRKRKAKK